MNEHLKNILFIFKMVMSLIYIVLGFTFIFKPKVLAEIIPSTYAPIVGALLIVYGLFRGYRAYTVERK